MNLSIFSFKINKNLKLILLFLLVFFSLNLFTYIIPEDYSGDLFKDAISYKNDKPNKNYFVKNIKVVVFGDSKATQAFNDFFNFPTLSLAAPNNTIIFSNFIFEQLKTNPLFKPKFVILYVGPNNFNKNGIFPKRDYAIRRLASFSQLFEMSKMNDGLTYAFDGFISKLIPIYARRMEIRHPMNLWKLITKNSNSISKIPGMYNAGKVFKNNINRDVNKDRNYALIYERSVYNKYETSKLHLAYLENMIKEIIQLGAQPIIVQLPIDKPIQVLRDKLIKDVFDQDLIKMKNKYKFIYINETKNSSFQFLDVNHLSVYGHKMFINEKINPIIK